MEPAGRTKIILATNVAETSITIPGIAAVIDSGLARVAGHSPWSGFPTLTTAKISKSSANQRAGRAAAEAEYNWSAAQGQLDKVYAELWP